jgi:MOSC domain-containing protein YiiM
MNVRILRQVAGEEDACCLSGDNLHVDLDLSEANLPAGTRLAIGDRVVLEVTPQPHTGCEKFETRYGKESRAFLNNRRGMELHLRGRFARVVVGGTIRVGDKISKLVVA